MRIALTFLAATSFFAVTVSAAGPALDTAKIEQLTGAKGKMDEKAGVFKVSVPRSDLKVTAAGVKMTPPMGLTSWAAFTSVGDKTAVMGDTVMTEDQVNAVMSAALDNGLEVTALHNHFFWDSPKVMFMHIGGVGDADRLAAAVGKVFATIKQTSGTGAARAPMAEIDSAKNSFDAGKLDGIFHAKGEIAPNGVYKVTIAKATKMHGHDMGAAMGVNTWAAFAGSDDKAVVDGDFAMSRDINVVAIHNHMTHEEPRVVFLHYWAVGRAADLAGNVKAALDAQAQSPARTAGDHAGGAGGAHGK